MDSGGAPDRACSRRLDPVRNGPLAWSQAGTLELAMTFVIIITDQAGRGRRIPARTIWRSLPVSVFRSSSDQRLDCKAVVGDQVARLGRGSIVARGAV